MTDSEKFKKWLKAFSPNSYYEGVEETSGEMASKSIGTTEDYVLVEKSGKTLLTIFINTHEEFVAMFNSGWPEAVNSIKDLSETTNVYMPNANGDEFSNTIFLRSSRIQLLHSIKRKWLREWSKTGIRSAWTVGVAVRLLRRV